MPPQPREGEGWKSKTNWFQVTSLQVSGFVDEQELATCELVTFNLVKILPPTSKYLQNSPISTTFLEHLFFGLGLRSLRMIRGHLLRVFSFLGLRKRILGLDFGALTPFPLSVMSKQDLISTIANSAGITKRAAGSALEAITGMITKELKKGNSVTITGFGTFRLSKRAARTGVNPRNPSQKISIPAMKVPSFKAGKTLKDAVR
jgi:DNA-binding protein HU-beta